MQVQAKPLYDASEWVSTEEYMAEAMLRLATERGCDVDAIDEYELKLELAEHMIASPMFTIRNFFYTVTKTRETILIEPFNGQIILDVAIESQRKRGYAQRVIEIKPRQVGWTAWNLARGMWYALQPNNIVVVYVPDKEVVKTLNQRFGTMYNNLGWAMPMARIDNQQELVLSNPNPKLRELMPGLDSSITVAPPGGKRGKTPNVAIFSEFAFMDNPEDLFDGVMSGMSMGAESCVIIDTTPNGYDDVYYPKVLEAVEQNPEWVRRWDPEYVQRYISGVPTRSDIVNGLFGEPDAPDEGWVPAFWPWFWHEQYTTKDESPLGQLPKMTEQQIAHVKDTIGKLEEYGGEEELELYKRYKVSIPRLWWRRRKIKTDTEGSDHRMKVLTFRQEYAKTWEDCFIDYGDTAFDPKGMDELSRQWRDTPYRGFLRRSDSKTTLQWELDSDAASQWDEMRIWAPAEPGERYVIGVDLGWSPEQLDSDATYACVLRRRDLKQVAVYESHAAMYRVREAIYALYKYYNNAFLGIETKGPGKNLVFELWQMGVTNQYKWKRLDRVDIRESDFLGWETSDHTRPTMEGILCEEVARRGPSGEPMPGITIRDRVTYQQLQSCKRYPDGKIKARGGAHDDAADALMIALAINRDPFNPYVPPRAQERRELDNVVNLFDRYISGRPDRNHPSLRDL